MPTIGRPVTRPLPDQPLTATAALEAVIPMPMPMLVLAQAIARSAKLSAN